MEKMKLTFVNVGYGEAMLLECPDASRPGGVFTALIDGGSAEASEFEDRSSGRLPVQEYLSARGLERIDLMVSTHTHEDHICGLLEAARLFPPPSSGRPCRRIITAACIRSMCPSHRTRRRANSCAR